MRHGSPWYKRFPVDFLGGVQGLTDRQHAVYSVILELIYQHGGDCRNDAKHIAGFFSNVGVAAVRRTIEELIEMGKLHLTSDGKISQKRAENELKTREKFVENAKDFGRKGAETKAANRENNNLDKGNPKSKNKLDTDTDTDTDNKKPPSEVKKGCRIPDDFEPDLDAAVEAGLRPEKAIIEAANFKDYWRAKSGKDATKLDWPATWRTWFRKAIERQGGPRGSPARGRSAFREHQDAITENLERMANGTGSYKQRDFDLEPAAYTSDRSSGSRK